MADTRKTDRRTLYTKAAIKDAFLRVKRSKEYNVITVADICREAEISRATFYTHFKNIAEVLDALLDDVLANRDYVLKYLTEAKTDAQSRCTYPLCQLVRDSQELRCIFFDDALNHVVIKKIAELFKTDYIREIQQISNSLSSQEAEALFYFQINGCYAISKQYSKHRNEEWCSIQNMMHQFIKGGVHNFLVEETHFLAD